MLLESMSNGSRGPQRTPSKQPLVSMGLPVYNGENYLREALESLVTQTFTDWELILSDNASTDATESICREYAARDGRIRYFREEVNRGATWNFNRVFHLANSPLFRWAAHDDVCEPELLERCVAVMQARPEVVLCYPRTRIIGPKGEHICDYGTQLRTDSPETGKRFHDLICVDHACFAIFGLVRTRLLRRTMLLGDYIGSDRNLLAELALYGPFHELPEFLFLRRDHPGTSMRQFATAKERLIAFHANAHGGKFPTLGRALGYWRSIVKVPMSPADRLTCVGILGKWVLMRFRSVLRRRAPSLGRVAAVTPPTGVAASPTGVGGSSTGIATSPTGVASTPVAMTLKRVFAFASSLL
jgi:glycosyltransferase involved in cell wall biosynthesis